MAPIDKIRALIQHSKRIQSRRSIEVEFEKVLPTIIKHNESDPKLLKIRSIYGEYGLKPIPNNPLITNQDFDTYDIKSLWNNLQDIQDECLISEMLEILGLKRVEIPKGSLETT